MALLVLMHSLQLQSPCSMHAHVQEDMSCLGRHRAMYAHMLYMKSCPFGKWHSGRTCSLVPPFPPSLLGIAPPWGWNQVGWGTAVSMAGCSHTCVCVVPPRPRCPGWLPTSPTPKGWLCVHAQIARLGCRFYGFIMAGVPPPAPLIGPTPTID